MLQQFWASLVAQLVKDLPAMWQTWFRSLGWEDPLEKGKATHSSIMAWRIPLSPWGCTGLDTTEQLHFHFQKIYMYTSIYYIYVCMCMYPLPVPYCFDYFVFVIKFSIEKYYFSNFLFVFHDCFGFLESLTIICELSYEISISEKKKYWNFHRNQTKCPYQFGRVGILIQLFFQFMNIGYLCICLVYH